MFRQASGMRMTPRGWRTSQLYGWLCCGMLLAPLGTTPSARTVMKCIGPDGAVSFAERCPPETTQSDSISVRTEANPKPKDQGPAKQDLKAEGLGVRKVLEATIYVSSSCTPCEVMEAHLKRRAVSFKRVDVMADAAAFDALKPKLSQVGVPVFVLGERIVPGFDPAAIDAALVAEGVLLATDIAPDEAREQAPGSAPAPAAPPKDEPTAPTAADAPPDSP